MKKLIWAIFASITIFSFGSAYADSITGDITGDNNVSYWNGSSWVGLGNNWQSAETLSLTVNAPSDIMYFAVSNDYTTPNSGYDAGGNPAGFLASFTDNTGTFAQTGTNTLLSNAASFKVLAVSPWIANPLVYPNIASISTINPTVNPTTLSNWITPSSYGTNGASLWSSANGGPVSGVNSNAQWIWTANNDGSFATENDYVLLDVNLGVNPLVTPEPPTVLLFAFAGAMIVFFNRKKLFATV